LSLTSCLIHESLADDASHQILGALRIVDAERVAIVMPEVEFRKVAMQ
jgi:hypothetical protein